MTDSALAAQTSDGMEFVADLRDIATPNPHLRRVSDPRAAARLIEREVQDRLNAVFANSTASPVVLLSGGVDSILVAAAAVSLGVRPHAITVVAEGGTDRTNAAAAAAALGLPHSVVELSEADVVTLAAQAMTRLGIPELWEVSYAIPLLATIPAIDELDPVGPILLGSGADAIVAGGKTLQHSIYSSEARTELDRIIRAESANNFVYDRLVPDFYPRVMGKYADHFVHVFQTVRMWEVAETLAPPALFGEHNGEPADKLCLRMACDDLLPEGAKHLAWARKAAIQRSAGIMGSLANAARRYAASMPGATTYTDPMNEPFEAVATRLFLALLNVDREQKGQP
ncbi:asparagine synthase-related protein [Nocardia sp. CC227C]|uniref:asparagine synthase-related protein n=1 Tax=Nocardia sp. CC227C TaxID=3044562 RepID=UPI00278BAE12|nr:asparagine synthase-related protein [Nocardia sp. CC227C]